MKLNLKTTVAALILPLVAVYGCSSSDDDDNDIDVGNNGDEEVFAFSTDAADTFTRVDRMGMPAIATALISSKDAYNDADPDNDIAGDFVPEILASLTFLHDNLDDDLTGAGLVPCTVVGDGTGTCAQAAVPLIIPDTLKIDTTTDAGFPNGRLLTDPVIDVTLAVALIELTGDNAQSATALAELPLGPPANDQEFTDAFPFLADPNQP